MRSKAGKWRRRSCQAASGEGAVVWSVRPASSGIHLAVQPTSSTSSEGHRSGIVKAETTCQPSRNRGIDVLKAMRDGAIGCGVASGASRRMRSRSCECACRIGCHNRSAPHHGRTLGRTLRCLRAKWTVRHSLSVHRSSFVSTRGTAVIRCTTDRRRRDREPASRWPARQVAGLPRVCEREDGGAGPLQLGDEIEVRMRSRAERDRLTR
jgi:hypothetical protein